MDFFQILNVCDADFVSILKIVRWVLNAICFGVPIILIVLTVLDIAKVVVAGNIDDKLKKEVGGKVTTRLIYAVIIFLVPTIVSLIFRMVPVNGNTGNASATLNGVTWKDCWDEAAQ